MHKAKKNSLAIAIAAAMLVPVALPVQAVDWTGQNSSDWFDAGNWNTTAVPGALDDAVIDTDASVAVIQGGTEADVRGIVIGNQAVGALTITGGGILSGQSGQVAGPVIGAQASSSGTVNVDGANGGATWNVGSTTTLLVGDAGQGRLTVVNGGVVNARGVEIGFGAGSTGEARIAGAGSSLNVEGQLFVGTFGKGSLTVSDSAAVNSGLFVVGAEEEGTAIVENGGSLVSGSEGLIVGGFGPENNIGKGTLIARNGGEISSNSGTLGATAGSVGEVAIGAGSRWAAIGSLSIGDFGEGRLVVEGGGQMNVNAEDNDDSDADGSAFLGGNRGAVGTVTIDGAGSVWTVAGTLFVGGSLDQDSSGEEGGTGHLTVSNGGRVDSGNSMIAASASSLGTVVVDGQGSVWSAGDLLIGRSGVGQLIVDNDANVTSASAFIGELAGSEGSVVVKNGGHWEDNNNDSLVVGTEGKGFLAIATGGEVVANGLSIGVLAGSEGAVTVDGAGSTIDAGLLSMSGSGKAALTIGNGGLARFTGAVVGSNDGSLTTMLIEGSGSRLETESGMLLAPTDASKASVVIRSGGILNTNIGASPNDVGARLGRTGSATATVTVDGAASQWTNKGILAIGGVAGADQFEGGQGVLTLRNGGRASTDTVRIADAAQSVGNLNIGAVAGETAASAGILDAPTVSFGSGAGAINLNHTDTDYVFDAAVTGAGAVNVLSGTTALTAANTYTGATHVSGGKLLVEGSLDGSAVTVTGGALGGRGSIAGQVNIAAGGTIAPGASIGTLTLNGDYVQSAGSTYEAEIDAVGNSDRIAVSGSAQLAGAVTVLGETALNKSYTLLTAGSGISGQYDTLNNATITPFLNFTLRYDPNAVFLDVTRSALTFASLGATRNQIATGAALDRLSASSPLLGVVVGLDQPTALGALDRLSGEIHASTRGVLLEDGRFVRDTANQRLRASQNHGERSGWIQAYGNSGSIDHDGNAAETDIGSGGVLLGADMAAGDARWGVMGGTGRISVQADERHSKANSDSLYLGAYAGTHWGAWDLRAGLAYGRHDVESERKVAFGDLNETLRANYDLETTQAFVEAAYRIDTEKSSFEPFLNLAAVKAKNDGYQENGGIAALRGGAEDTDTGLATLGLRVMTRFQWAAVPASLHGSLGWRHAFGDTLPLSRHAFAGGDAFVIAGARIAEEAAVASARLDLQLSERATLGLGYSGQLGDDSRENSVQAQLQVKF